MIRTKIVVTLGPASEKDEVLLRLLEEGADVCRLNFSHGELADHQRMLTTIRKVTAGYHEPVAVLGDLCGPKIRLGKVADEGGSGGMAIQVGDPLHIQRQPLVGGNGRVCTNYPGFVDDVQIGDRVLIEDGLLRFLAIDKPPDEVICTCVAGGVIKSNKGINLPNTTVRVPSITEKDWQCVDWAIENGLDYLALSFVRRPEDLISLREHLRRRNSNIGLIAKIEKAEAVQAIDAILEASDGLMVARGDLGVEMDVAQVPIIQKDLIRRCQQAGKPVIVATQMLQSMIEQSSPTRAEISDVANAIFDGTDAVMLSGETSVGRFPLAAVHTMAHVAEVTEQYLDGAGPSLMPLVKDNHSPIPTAVARGVWQIAVDLKVKLVVLWSQTGQTARIFAKHRFPLPIVALSSDKNVLRQMALHYGVLPRLMERPADMPALIEQVDTLVVAEQLAKHAERILIVAGSSMDTPGIKNGIVIHTVGTAG
jgi:pyruvate kinase